MSKTITTACAALSLALTIAAEAAAQPATLRPLPPVVPFAVVQEADRVQTLRDQNECRTQGVKDGRVSPVYSSPMAGGLAGAVVSAVIVTIGSDIAGGYRISSLIKSCMVQRGYHPIDFTPDQVAALKAMTAKERTAFYDVTPAYALDRDGATLRPASYTYLDPATRQVVGVRQDPFTGQASRSWTVRP